RAAVLHRLERLERRLTIAPPLDQEPPVAQPPVVPSPIAQPPRTQPRVAQPPVTQPPIAQPPVAQPPVAQPPSPEAAKPGPVPEQPDAATVRRHWAALLEAVREQSRTTQVLLSNATASAVQGSTLVLTLPNAPLARRLGDDRNVELIRAALRAVLGVDWQVRCEHADGEAGAGGTGSTPQHTAQRATRPPQRSAERPAYRRPATTQAPDDGIPAPPEPSDPADPGAADLPPAPMDDEAMLAEASGMTREPPSRRDPEEVALELLADQLGARRIDG
ncbi:MAG: DNA polymerase III subunit gamma/tau, partial [Pseudonocardiaceae bacterium]